MVRGRVLAIRSQKKQIEDELSQIQHILNNEQNDPRALKQYINKIYKKIPQEDVFNLKLFDDMYKGRVDVEEVKKYIQKRKELLEEYLKQIEKEAQLLLEQEKERLYKTPMAKPQGGLLEQFLTDIEQKKLPLLKSLPFYPNRRRPSPKFNPVIPPIAQCTTQRQYFFRKYIIFNEGKYRYCDNIKKRLLHFKMDDFVEYFPRVKEAFVRLTNLKKTFYCVLCDYQMQRAIDVENQLVFMSKDFCSSLVFELKEFFLWKNVLFMRYVHNLFQIVNCFDSSGEIEFVNFKNVLTKRYQQSFFIKRCTKHIGTPNEFRYCHFLCSKYRVDGLSAELEEDLTFLKSVYHVLVSFVRKLNV